MHTYDVVNSSLDGIDDLGCLGLGALCVHRMAPHYVSFESEARPAHSFDIEGVLHRMWQHSMSIREYSSEQRASDLHSLESAIPDSDDYPSGSRTLAQNVLFGLAKVLDFLSSAELSDITAVFQYAIDSVDFLVQESENMNPMDPTRERRILTHRLMQAELEWISSAVHTVSTSRLPGLRSLAPTSFPT